MSAEMPENLLWGPGDSRLTQEILAVPLLDVLVVDSEATEVFRVPEFKPGEPPVVGFYGAMPVLVHPLHAIVSFAEDELPATRSEMRRLLSVRLQAVGDDLMQQWEARQENRDVAES